MKLRNSSLAWALAALHFGYLLGVLAMKEPEPYPGPPPPGSMSFSGWSMYGSMIGARFFHHEPLLTDLVMIVDLPALIVTTLVALPIDQFFDRVVGSYAAAVLWLLLGSLQWYLIGLAIARRFRTAGSDAAASASTS